MKSTREWIWSCIYLQPCCGQRAPCDCSIEFGCDTLGIAKFIGYVCPIQDDGYMQRNVPQTLVAAVDQIISKGASKVSSEILLYNNFRYNRQGSTDFVVVSRRLTTIPMVRTHAPLLVSTQDIVHSPLHYTRSQPFNQKRLLVGHSTCNKSVTLQAAGLNRKLLASHFKMRST